MTPPKNVSVGHSGPHGQQEQQEHPMVAVPDAIRIVLVETCRQVQLLQQQQYPSEEIFLFNDDNVDGYNNSAWHKLQGRILLDDFCIQAPGYPPYAASIMDGYATHLTDTTGSSDDVGLGRDNSSGVGMPTGALSATDNGNTTSDEATPRWTHVLRDNIYAGDNNAIHLRHSTELSVVEPTLSEANKQQHDNTTATNANFSNINSSYNDGDNDEDDIQSMTSSQLNFKEIV